MQPSRLRSACQALLISSILITTFAQLASAQSTKFTHEGTLVTKIQNGTITFDINRPIISYQIGSKTFDATQSSPVKVSVGPARSEGV